MSISRRKFIHLFSLGSTAFISLLTPVSAWATWANKAFNAGELDTAYQNLFGSSTLSPSNDVILKLPKIAENGAAVPISIKTDLIGVESISIFVNDNPLPLTASFQIPSGTMAKVSTRIRLTQTCTVTAVVKIGDKLYSQSQEVSVTHGGCGA